MNGMEVALVEAMTELEPSDAQVMRIGRVVASTVDRLRLPLWREWIDMFRLQPVRSGVLVLAGACVLMLTTPIGAVLVGLLSRQG